MSLFPIPLRITVIGNGRKAGIRTSSVLDYFTERGARVSQRVTKETDVLFVVGSAGGTQVRKARELAAAGHRILMPGAYDGDLLVTDPEAFCRRELPLETQRLRGLIATDAPKHLLEEPVESRRDAQLELVYQRPARKSLFTVVL